MNENKSTENDCIFCRISKGDALGYVVQENETAFAILDINPLAQGHCLVLPRRHVPWWHDMTVDETRDLFELAQRTARRIMEVFKPDFVAMYARGRRPDRLAKTMAMLKRPPLH